MDVTIRTRCHHAQNDDISSRSTIDVTLAIQGGRSEPFTRLITSYRMKALPSSLYMLKATLRKFMHKVAQAPPTRFLFRRISFLNIRIIFNIWFIFLVPSNRCRHTCCSLLFLSASLFSSIPWNFLCKACIFFRIVSKLRKSPGSFQNRTVYAELEVFAPELISVKSWNLCFPCLSICFIVCACYQVLEQ